jgi:hypothetical protein
MMAFHELELENPKFQVLINNSMTIGDVKIVCPFLTACPDLSIKESYENGTDCYHTFVDPETHSMIDVLPTTAHHPPPEQLTVEILRKEHHKAVRYLIDELKRVPDDVHVIVMSHLCPLQKDLPAHIVEAMLEDPCAKDLADIWPNMYLTSDVLQYLTSKVVMYIYGHTHEVESVQHDGKYFCTNAFMEDQMTVGVAPFETYVSAPQTTNETPKTQLSEALLSLMCNTSSSPMIVEFIPFPSAASICRDLLPTTKVLLVEDKSSSEKRPSIFNILDNSGKVL